MSAYGRESVSEDKTFKTLAPEPPAPTTNGNLVLNSSFESGMDHWESWDNTYIDRPMPEAGIIQWKSGPSAGGFGQYLDLDPSSAGRAFDLYASGKLERADDASWFGAGVQFFANGVKGGPKICCF